MLAGSSVSEEHAASIFTRKAGSFSIPKDRELNIHCHENLKSHTEKL
jgi:hypothetical protein